MSTIISGDRRVRHIEILLVIKALVNFFFVYTIEVDAANHCTLA